MKLRDLIRLFEYGERVTIEGSPCCWCVDELTETMIFNNSIPQNVMPYLDNEVVSIETEMVNGGYCCGEMCEYAVMNITIK